MILKSKGLVTLKHVEPSNVIWNKYHASHWYSFFPFFYWPMGGMKLISNDIWLRDMLQCNQALMQVHIFTPKMITRLLVHHCQGKWAQRYRNSTFLTVLLNWCDAWQFLAIDFQSQLIAIKIFLINFFSSGIKVTLDSFVKQISWNPLV